VDRKYILINLNLLKLLSRDTVVQGNVRSKRETTDKHPFV
jgi:hypothetical protein